MVRVEVYDVRVAITADQLRDARVRAGFTSQAAFAEALGVSERTVSYWEAEGGKVSTRAEARVRDLLWPKQPERPERYSDMSNAALLAEMNQLLGVIGRRLVELETVRKPEDSPTGDDPKSFRTTHEVYEVPATVRGNDTAAGARPDGSSTTRAGSARIKGRGPRIK